MKLLFTSVGRRVELIQAFKKVANESNIDLHIIGADISVSAPALFYCDSQEIICRISDATYIPSLLKLCKVNEVDCLIPTIDTDLLLLSQNKHLFEQIGTKVLISAEEKVAICRDKRFTSSYFESLGLKAPLAVDSVDTYKSGYPAFIKPKDGSSSINAYKVSNLEDLKVYADKIGDYVIQPFIDGREYTVDVLCDYFGNPIYITPRERLVVRAGEVIKTQITQDDQIINEIKVLLNDFKPSGPITVQLIRDNASGIDYYIEINPRFGGGAPLSMKAGADSARAILEMLANDGHGKYFPYAARDGEVYSRFDQSICVQKGKLKSE